MAGTSRNFPPEDDILRTGPEQQFFLTMSLENPSLRSMLMPRRWGRIWGMMNVLCAARPTDINALN